MEEVMPQPTVVVFSDDPIVKQGADAYLRTVDELRLVTLDALPTADVVLVFAGRVTEGTMDLLRGVADAGPQRCGRLVLVTGEMDESYLLRAVEYGMTTLLMRPDSDYSHVVGAILDPDGATMPSALMRTMADYLRRAHELGTGGHSLSGREIDILRMLADGADTAEIADRMSYSERTVKRIINTVQKRLSLRNRAHAVSYALRAGLL
jgi:DNA-binding NarL/FixJ family response regulator